MLQLMLIYLIRHSFGSRVVKGIQLSDYAGMLDERALFVGQWGLKGNRGEYENMVEAEGRPTVCVRCSTKFNQTVG
jgi:cobalamin-dependent methionine synthase I